MAGGSLNWKAFFERRPDLEPPGYRETIAKMGYNNKDPEDEGDIKF